MNYTFNEQPFSLREPGLGWIVIILALQFVVINLVLVLLELKVKVNFNRFVPHVSWRHPSQQQQQQHHHHHHRQLAYRVDESSLSSSSSVVDDVDAGVRNESFRIQTLDTRHLVDPVVVKNLVRRFKKNGRNFNAVNNINFGIGKGECFG